jgi:glycosyltransferase involved in cell wall biosynthesis
MPKTLFVVSANLPHGPVHDPAGPRKDYVAVAERLGDVDVLDWSRTRRVGRARAIERTLGLAAAQAWVAYTLRDSYDVILTDGEHVGIPLALLLKQQGARVPHVTIGHRLSAKKKLPFFRVAGVQSHLARIILHSRYQYDIAVTRLGLRREQLSLVPYQVDAGFWRPQDTPEERLISSAGLEFRDYPTLFTAVEGLDARVIIGAASHWSRRRNTALATTRPPNVEVGSFDYRALRDLFARAAIVVVPVDDVDFQAGVTTVLEAMAMAKPVIVTHSHGQTDVIEDRRAATRGAELRTRPVSLLRALADEAGIPVEPNGFYVPPKDPEALRRAIAFLLDRPDERRKLGSAGRRIVERLMTVEQFAERVGRIVEDVAAGRPGSGQPEIDRLDAARPGGAGRSADPAARVETPTLVAPR